jgi:hypothetical protein
VNIDPLAFSRLFERLTRMVMLKDLREIRDAGIGLFVPLRHLTETTQPPLKLAALRPWPGDYSYGPQRPGKPHPRDLAPLRLA